MSSNFINVLGQNFKGKQRRNGRVKSILTQGYIFWPLLSPPGGGGGINKYQNTEELRVRSGGKEKRKKGREKREEKWEIEEKEENYPYFVSLFIGPYDPKKDSKKMKQGRI